MSETRSTILKLHPEDNVVLALVDIPGGSEPAPGVFCKQRIPAAHKIASEPIPAGAPIVKYGQIIGFASTDIPAGVHVHTHNVLFKDFPRDSQPSSGKIPPQETLPPEKRSCFNGILRPDGRAGTRNYIGIIPTSACSSQVAVEIARSIGKIDMEPFTHVDGIVALPHKDGCGMLDRDEGLSMLQRTVAGYADNPNFASVVLVSLGCEVNQPEALCEMLASTAWKPVVSIDIQKLGGARAAINAGHAAVMDMLTTADQARRQSLSAEHLVVGLECGGSDAYSGISANPALGAAVDLLVQNGGTAILSETPEIYMAEHLLARRAANPRVHDDLLDIIDWWETYSSTRGQTINNNPTPGNKAGGLTTIAEKSLGAVAKGGTSPLNAVYRYAEKVNVGGLVFMDSPGYDPVSITGKVAGGATLICFTTGCGSVSGCKPSPVLKLASNSNLYLRLEKDMDINCGSILDGETSVETMGRRIFERILSTASGSPTKSEQQGFGDMEFSPWLIGGVL
ncbi:MAG TPA: altronate dehydratase [Desulfobacteraceae bacterium]|nr:altronate dehydratase [Desulfobacteraceae bacterium]